MKTYTHFKSLFLSILLFSSLSIFAANSTDNTIEREISSQISANTLTSNLRIEVRSDNGVVALSGTTQTDKEASAAVEIAQSVEGVKEVNTAQLRVEKSEHPLDDTFITAKVKGLFARHKLFNNTSGAVPLISINVETKNGIVHLTGHAENDRQIKNAIDLAKSVKGVKGVDSKVVVKK